MNETESKLRASPPQKEASSAASLTSPPPSSANVATTSSRGTIQRKSSHVRISRNQKSSSLGSLLLVLAFVACFMQLLMSRETDQLLRQHQQSHWFDGSAWTLDASTLNRNIMGVPIDSERDMAASKVDALISIDNSTNGKQEQQDGSINSSHEHEHPILRLLRSAGIDDLTEEEKKHLPDWKALQSLYGDLEEPVIVGLETCATYRNTVPPHKRYAAVAGMFNTGTNAMEHHLRKNIEIKNTWQVPWGKHRMEFVRLNHTANGLEKYNHLEVLPVVLIRDPYSWMHSMCKSPYAAHWKHRAAHCPNLVPDKADRRRFKNEINDTFPVKVIFDENQKFYWDSLAHLWSDWYQRYLKATYPRLIIRFEDMILHAPAIMKKIADCTDTTVPSKFTFQTASSKNHGSGTTFLKVVEKTGNAALRVAKMSRADLLYAQEHLDANLMRIFQYAYPFIDKK